MSKKGILLCGHGTRVKRGEEAFKKFAAEFAQRVPQYEVEPGFLELSVPDFEVGIKRLVAKGPFWKIMNHTIMDMIITMDTSVVGITMIVMCIKS